MTFSLKLAADYSLPALIAARAGDIAG